MSQLIEAAKAALDALTNCTSEHGHRCNRCDSEIDEGGRVAEALREALAAAEAQPESLTGVGTDRPRDTSATHCAVPVLLDGAAEAQPAPAVSTGWTGNADADLALILLDRLDDTGEGNAARIDQLEGLVRKLAAPAAAAQPESAPVAVPQGWKLVPEEPAEDQWAHLARDIVTWLYMSGAPHYGSKLHKHLAALGREIPAWLNEYVPNIDHTPPKGAVAIAIYRAMLAAAPSAPVAAAPAPQPLNLLPVIQWLENGCDPKEAAKELRAYQAVLDGIKGAA